MLMMFGVHLPRCHAPYEPNSCCAFCPHSEGELDLVRADQLLGILRMAVLLLIVIG
jgi:hypothetical protein